jgi:hypothetical protein
MPSPRILRVAGLEGVGGARLSQRLGKGLERRHRLLGAATQQDDGVLGQGHSREVTGEPRLPDCGLTRDQHDPPVMVRLHPAPGGAQPLEFAATADELHFILPREAGRRWDRRRVGATEIF